MIILTGSLWRQLSDHRLSLLCSGSVCAPPFHSLEGWEGGRNGRGEGWEEGGRKEEGGKGGKGGRGLLGSISEICLELTSPHTQLCSQLSEGGMIQNLVLVILNNYVRRREGG